MKTLLRLWSLVLDFVMLVLLLTAPVPTGERPAPRAQRQPFIDERALRGEFVTASPAFPTSRFALRRGKPRQ